MIMCDHSDHGYSGVHLQAVAEVLICFIDGETAARALCPAHQEELAALADAALDGHSTIVSAVFLEV